MKSSRFYQTACQTVGSVGEIILFLAGFFLGKEMFVVALTFLAIRVAHKLVLSELMYRRSKAVIREEVNNETIPSDSMAKRPA